MHQNAVRKKVCTKMLLVNKCAGKCCQQKSMHQNVICKNACTKMSFVKMHATKCCQEKIMQENVVSKKVCIKTLFSNKDIQSLILQNQILLDSSVIIWIFVVQILIMLTLVMLILIKMTLKLLFLSDLWFGVTDLNNVKHLKKSQAKN